jgi:hypothetical protein
MIFSNLNEILQLEEKICEMIEVHQRKKIINEENYEEDLELNLDLEETRVKNVTIIQKYKNYFLFLLIFISLLFIITPFLVNKKTNSEDINTIKETTIEDDPTWKNYKIEGKVKVVNWEYGEEVKQKIKKGQQFCKKTGKTRSSCDHKR